MSDFDQKLKQLLSEDDEAFITDAIDENGYYKTVLGSLKGQGSTIRIATWISIFVICGLLFFCVWKFFHVETTRDQILYASLVILLNSAQIALKMWFNMQLNRRIITHEIKLLQLALAKSLQS